MFLRVSLIAGGVALALSLPTGAAAQPVSTVISDLNLRAGPGTGYARIDVMPGGAAVTVSECTGGWCQVTHAGRTGWASARYLDITVAGTLEVQEEWVAGPPMGFAFGVDGVPPTHWDDGWDDRWFAYWGDWDRPYWYAGWDEPDWWFDRPAGWYGPVYWDDSSWWHAGNWYTSPGFAIEIGLR